MPAAGLESQLQLVLDKPSLASVNVVSGLIREAFGKAIARRGDYFAGKVPDAATLDIADMRGLASLLQGHGAESYALQPWNSEQQMGQYIKDAYGMQCGAAEAVFTLLLSVLVCAYTAIDESVQRNSDAAADVNVLTDQATFAVLGLPWPKHPRDESSIPATDVTPTPSSG
jgi:hypothetical protein